MDPAAAAAEGSPPLAAAASAHQVGSVELNPLYRLSAAGDSKGHSEAPSAAPPAAPAPAPALPTEPSEAGAPVPVKRQTSRARLALWHVHKTSKDAAGFAAQSIKLTTVTVLVGVVVGVLPLGLSARLAGSAMAASPAANVSSASLALESWSAQDFHAVSGTVGAILLLTT